MLEARFGGAEGTYYPGVVVAVHGGDDDEQRHREGEEGGDGDGGGGGGGVSYDIAFDDGDQEERVPRARVRARPPPTT